MTPAPQPPAGGERLKQLHRFLVNGHRFVYDVEDLAIFEIDEAVWDLVGGVGAEGGGLLRKVLTQTHGAAVADEVLDELARMGLLMRGDGPSSRGAQVAEGLNGVTLNLTHGCNLRCRYCYAHQGDYGLGRSLMSVETVQQAIDWLAERSAGAPVVRIDLFGGEPMLNTRGLRGAIRYASERFGRRGQQVRFHVTTNGTRFDDENLALLGTAENVDVQVSLDGLPGVNDSFRIFPDGGGSHAAVVEGIERVKSALGAVAVRATIPPGHPLFGDSLRHLLDEVGASTVAFELASGAVDGRSIDSDEVAEIEKEWGRVAEHFAEHAERGEVKPIANLLKILRSIHRRRKRTYFCAAGLSHLTIDPIGDIYPCHRFVGDPEWKMGNVRCGDPDDDLRERFAANTVDRREPCAVCWARSLCGGLCAHEGLQATGTIHRPDPLRCRLMRRLVELALVLYVRLKPHEEKLVRAAAALKG